MFGWLNLLLIWYFIVKEHNPWGIWSNIRGIRMVEMFQAAQEWCNWSTNAVLFSYYPLASF